MSAGSDNVLRSLPDKVSDLERHVQALIDGVNHAQRQLRMVNRELDTVEVTRAKIAEQRKKWAARLITVRHKRWKLQEIIRSLGEQAAQVPANIDRFDYPVIPSAAITPTTEAADIPEASGIYFLWRSARVEYVGKSVNLRNRLRLSKHHALKADHRISFLIMPRDQLSWAEHYYIGILRPKANGGSNGFHNKYNTQGAGQ